MLLTTALEHQPDSYQHLVARCATADDALLSDVGFLYAKWPRSLLGQGG